MILKRDFLIATSTLSIILLLFLPIFPHIPRTAQTDSAPIEARGQDLVPDSMIYFSPENTEYALLVEKRTQRAYLYSSFEPGHPLKTYPCSTGENRGPKCEKDDKKTPEGIYFITNSFKEKGLPPIYGVRAFPIDYPNPLDRKLGRKGYGIWIHGSNQPITPHNTNGCVVFRNKDLLELSEYLCERRTPITITQEIKFIKKEELQREREALKRFILQWLEAWKKGQIDRYMSFYWKGFKAGNKDWHQWRAHNRMLSERYGAIDIRVENLQILRENGVVLARFDQTYSANGFFSAGKKRLYLQKISPEWKITDEFFIKVKEIALTAPATFQREQEVALIKDIIFTWQKAWQEKNLQEYLAIYSDDFYSSGLNKDGWKRHKSQLNSRYNKIEVAISNLQIKLLSSERAIVNFNQEYRSENYHDIGKKTIQLVKRGKKWRIKKETWVPLRGKKIR